MHSGKDDREDCCQSDPGHDHHGDPGFGEPQGGGERSHRRERETAEAECAHISDRQGVAGVDGISGRRGRDEEMCQRCDREAHAAGDGRGPIAVGFARPEHHQCGDRHCEERHGFDADCDAGGKDQPEKRSAKHTLSPDRQHARRRQHQQDLDAVVVDASGQELDEEDEADQRDGEGGNSVRLRHEASDKRGTQRQQRKQEDQRPDDGCDVRLRLIPRAAARAPSGSRSAHRSAATTSPRSRRACCRGAR